MPNATGLAIVAGSLAPAARIAGFPARVSHKNRIQRASCMLLLHYVSIIIGQSEPGIPWRQF